MRIVICRSPGAQPAAVRRGGRADDERRYERDPARSAGSGFRDVRVCSRHVSGTSGRQAGLRARRCPRGKGHTRGAKRHASVNLIGNAYCAAVIGGPTGISGCLPTGLALLTRGNNCRFASFVAVIMANMLLTPTGKVDLIPSA